MRPQRAAAHSEDLASYWYRPDNSADVDALLGILLGRPWNPVRAKMNGAAVSVDLVLARRGERLCLISAEDAVQVGRLAASVHILPRRAWQRSHDEVLLDDLRRGYRTGVALVAAEGGDLICYFDYVPPQDGEIDLGFALTRPDWRGRGLVVRLMATLLLSFFSLRFVCSTAESNRPVQKILRRFGFVLDRLEPNDRVNGEATLIFTRQPGVAFDLLDARRG
jgi:ribosomal protein S18 acetylase RimI-like enzyme